MSARILGRGLRARAREEEVSEPDPADARDFAKAMSEFLRSQTPQQEEAEGCPVCNWQQAPGDEPYLCALADVARLGGVENVPLCAEHQKQLDAITSRDKE